MTVENKLATTKRTPQALQSLKLREVLWKKASESPRKATSTRFPNVDTAQRKTTCSRWLFTRRFTFWTRNCWRLKMKRKRRWSFKASCSVTRKRTRTLGLTIWFIETCAAEATLSEKASALEPTFACTSEAPTARTPLPTWFWALKRGNPCL